MRIEKLKTEIETDVSVAVIIISWAGVLGLGMALVFLAEKLSGQ